MLRRIYLTLSQHIPEQMIPAIRDTKSTTQPNASRYQTVLSCMLSVTKLVSQTQRGEHAQKNVTQGRAQRERNMLQNTSNVTTVTGSPLQKKEIEARVIQKVAQNTWLELQLQEKKNTQTHIYTSTSWKHYRNTCNTILIQFS